MRARQRGQYQRTAVNNRRGRAGRAGAEGCTAHSRGGKGALFCTLPISCAQTWRHRRSPRSLIVNYILSDPRKPLSVLPPTPVATTSGLCSEFRTGYLKAMATKAVAASNEIVDDDGIRRPAGDVHAWTVGTNQSVCGLALSRSQLRRFPHVSWSEVYAVTGGYSHVVQRVCPRCAAAVGGRVQSRWTRRNPRP